MNAKTPEIYDYIVIGAGSAGSVLANRLTEDPAVSVLVLEAGGPDRKWDFRIQMPAALIYPLNSKTYNWQFLSEPVPELGGRQMPYFRGKTLGGSSTINGMVYVRGNAMDFDGWAEEPGLEHWSYADCLPYFRKSETYSEGADDYRGGDGPLHVSRPPVRSRLYDTFIEAGAEAGHARVDDTNGYRQEGFAYFDATIHKGVRESTARAYLHPVMHRPNLTVVTGAMVGRIEIRNGRTSGVSYRSQGKDRTATVEREVILCAGAIQSPQMLMLSGIGDPERLKRHGIETRCELPGVGRNLADHLEWIVSYTCKKPLSFYEATKPHKQALIGAQWYLSKTGLGTSNFFEAGGFLKSDPGKPYPDVHLHFVGLAAEYSGRLSAPGHSYQVHLSTGLPESRGWVDIRSDRPDDAPVIQPNYLSEPNDWTDARRAIRLSEEVLEQSAFEPFRDRQLLPGRECKSPSDLDAYIRQHAETGYHYAGTCRMGTDDGAVVDGELNVRGVMGLRVVDTSVMPRPTNSNTNAPTIMIAEKAADMILGKPALPRSAAPAYRTETSASIAQ